jgi:hypothetical protein
MYPTVLLMERLNAKSAPERRAMNQENTRRIVADPPVKKIRG